MNRKTHSARLRQPRELTGRAVLWCLLGFFAVVIGINAAMVRAATSTFGGIETESSYKAGLQFSQELAAAHHQAARHWQVSGTIARDAAGDAVLDVRVRDRNGASLTGLTLVAQLAHPADARLDRIVPVRERSAGAFRGSVPAEAGQWDLMLDLYRGGERLYRSKSRVGLR